MTCTTLIHYRNALGKNLKSHAQYTFIMSLALYDLIGDIHGHADGLNELLITGKIYIQENA